MAVKNICLTAVADVKRLRAFFIFMMLSCGALIWPQQAMASKYASIVINAESGRVMYARNADAMRYPASLTKIMTLYLLFEEIKSGRMDMNSRIGVSKLAASRSPSKLYLKPGQSISAEQAIYALVTKSANDVATAVAEAISGTERNFAKRMTRKARALGMRKTVFKNASGLPHSQQKTTARDMARLAVAMRRDFPRLYRYFSTQNFNWKGRKFGNHNKLLAHYSGTDGIKTGYINASGFNLVASVKRHGVRLIGVIFGGKTSRSRDAHMMKILDAQFKRAKPAEISAQVAAVDMPQKLPKSPPKRSNLVKVRRLAKLPLPKEEFLDTPQTFSLSSSGARRSPEEMPDAAIDEVWSVQIGSFARRVNAHRAAAKARRMVDNVLGMTPARLTLVTSGNMPLWRVRFHDLDETQARSACAALFAEGSPCIAVREKIRNTS
ncbi:D-alanyl-D-alanine carboxypeptidase family protein [Candidatus Puniceispirillum marinum]|uniref:D-alanyl-D-alanine carboxypeptidase n=1 Tax=Puniceispirillum marinum (strain IMCC1322) TaxID=488538 RepID=D5BSP6_PUNMI|nr:D-alanyl-D-alanine carboxypeptidase family protein [Candidatus Puniceispirillum marinum]ADE39293.1 D-alanyl-D-alanine carboxypeptidase [Candidatus Puniceispirillum marinum IMCC1322]